MAASAQSTNAPSSTPANPGPPPSISPSTGTGNSGSNHDHYFTCLFVIGTANQDACIGHDRLDGRQQRELVIRQQHIDGHGNNERRDHRWYERDGRNFQRRRWRGRQTVIDVIKSPAVPRPLNALR